MAVQVMAPQNQKKDPLETAAQVMNIGMGAANLAGSLGGLGGAAAPAADASQNLAQASGTSDFGGAMQRRLDQMSYQDRSVAKPDGFGLGVTPQPKANPGLGVVPQQQAQYGLFKR